MDFYRIETRTDKKGKIEVYPVFIVRRSKDLIIKGGKFYAVWDEKEGLWSKDEMIVQQIIDADLRKKADELREEGKLVKANYLSAFNSRMWIEWKKYISTCSDSKETLDNQITFLNEEVKKSDYRSKRLPYSLAETSCPAYDQLMSTLYDEDERKKLEWGVGAVLRGDGRKIQKFFVLFGAAGTGKSTFLDILQRLVEGYYCTFDSESLGSKSSQFSTESFRGNPLVAIQHDGDLSRIETNTRLNSIISHEEIVINEKYKAGYSARINAVLFMGTNKPVRITDSKSGIIRRLIDVHPSGRTFEPSKYFSLKERIPFEIGSIAKRCIDIYDSLGRDYYSGYKPVDMMFQTDVFFNFVDAYSDIFMEQEGVTLQQAFSMYKEYCDDGLIDHRLPKYKFREELKSYFQNFEERAQKDGKRIRSYYSGFISGTESKGKDTKKESWLKLDCTESLLDKELGECPAQYASDKGTPQKKWIHVTTRLRDLDTGKEHYVRLPENHIVIDFDLKNEKGEKDANLNISAASAFPPTYCEYSRGGNGLHLHYIYNGDSSLLSSVYSEGIEVKVFKGNSSLRRKLSFCNDIQIATIDSGLPLKGGKKVVSFEVVKTEKALRARIIRNLNKEIHPYTKPSVDLIFKILEDAYSSGLKYDITDMRPAILSFAAKSTNQSKECLRLVNKMRFKSEEDILSFSKPSTYDKPLVFFDVEVFPNLFLVCWKVEGEGKTVVRLFNPSPSQIEEIMSFNLVGFNCRRYDNHILYARYLGYTNQQLFDLSQKITVLKSKNCFFSEAYSISYTDVYDFASASNKMGLKKWEIELGIHHQENEFPWDQPLPEENWETVARYCENDVLATEAVFNHLRGDWVARQILSELSGFTVNDTTNQHSTRIIFGDNKHPQSEFVYTDLSTIFPGYKFDHGKSSYRGEDPGEGGYVYAEPGIYGNVALLDVASMHPTSIEQLNLFGPYTKRFSDIKSARLAIKHKDINAIKSLLDGKLVPFFERAEAGEFSFKELSNALKTVINSVYGLTSASFDNPFRDPRNIDNIVAKRGALFMIDLKHAVQERGYKVAHIKTDSIKIPDATPEIIDFVMEFGKKYGYEFEHETTYDRICLVNNAVYIARDKNSNEWTATGAEFQHPYVFKTLFSKEDILFKDYCETKSVSTSMYLDFDESLDDGQHNLVFVGKVGQFCPIKPGCNGGVLLREKDSGYSSVTGTKDYRWHISEAIKASGREADIDMDYFRNLVDDAKDDISKYGDFETFVSEEPYSGHPWHFDPLPF